MPNCLTRDKRSPQKVYYDDNQSVVKCPLLTVEMNLYLSLLEDVGDGTVESVDFATHTTAEHAGAGSDACFIAWISDCMTGAAADAGTDSGDDTGSTPGDLNGDGSADASDLTILARHVGKVEYITDETALANADVTGDGAVDANDLTKLAQYVGKIISSLTD